MKKESARTHVIVYMDETWIWRYHSKNKGPAPRGTTRKGGKARKGQRAIIIDAITSDGVLYTLDQNFQIDKRALMHWVYDSDEGSDYHDAVNFEKSQRRIEHYILPSFHAKYPGKCQF